ncbi:hypothetical protein ACIBCT_40150 [Streptosporangium sp. NPDC050855]|uniref:hypothetical protein n=1 Tax=Streptosporangium sp. NPDC050855 TaxID=3366194 RepID=UPI00378BBDBA
MNDRSAPDGDRLVHKADQNDERPVGGPGENDPAASGHAQNASSRPRETPPDDTLVARREDSRAGDAHDVTGDGPRDDRRASSGDDLVSDHDAPLSAGRRDVPDDDPGDGRAGTLPRAQAADTPAGGSTAHDRVPDSAGFPDSTAGRPDDVLDEGSGFTDVERPVTPAAGPPILFDQDSEGIRRRWQEVQASFVDDPRQAVERADSLLDEVTSSFRSALEARASELQGRWKNIEKNDTEDLRTALRDYRATLEQLLNITAGTR